MLLFSDLHLSEDSADVVLQEVLPGIRESALSLGESRIGFLGDWWHIRYRVDVRLLNAVRDELRRWHADGLTLEAIPGNHDAVDMQGRHALEVMADWPGVSIYSVPTATKDGVWLPWNVPVAAAKAVAKKTTPKVLFAHIDLVGAQMNAGLAAKEGVEPKDLIGWDTVFSGHYHMRQSYARSGKVPEVRYVGSPWQVTAAEAGQAKGFVVWDLKKANWHEREWGPRHVKVAWSGSAPEEMKFRAGDVVHVTASPGTDLEAVAKQLTDLGVRYTITPATEQAKARLELREGAAIREYAQAYVDQMKGDLDAAKLMAVYDQVTT